MTDHPDSKRVLAKVAAFVTRDKHGSRELLVFRHPTAGVQLPAGTVEKEETIENAVLREVREETGLTELEFCTILTSFAQEMLAEQCAVLEDGALLDEANHPVYPLTRGLLVKAVPGETRAGYRKVIYEEYDFGPSVPVLSLSQSGWIAEKGLASGIERHLIHLKATGYTRDSWTIAADRGHEFKLYWVPLAQNPGLMPNQAEWLERVQGELLK